MDGAPTNPRSPLTPLEGPDAACGQGPSCRLNLLLSYAGWQPHSWADRLPVLLQPMGIRALRASSGREASQLIHVYPVHVAVVDLAIPLEAASGPACQADSLPPTSDIRHPTSDIRPTIRPTEEAGIRILELLARLDSPPPILVIKRSRTHRDDSREIAAALRANAFAVLDRPRDTPDLERLLDTLRRCLDRHYRGRWPLS
ncbi:MAG: hypothetical protein WD749_07620 [Phycisphaerales bacterium]